MGDFIVMFFGFWERIFNVFRGTALEIGSFNVDLASIIISFIIVGFVIAVFWKGART